MTFECEDTSMALEIAFRILPINRVEFLQAVETLLSSKPASPGLAGLNCFEEVGLENTFLWRECWNSVDELEIRLQSTGIKTLLGAIGVLGELDRFEILAPGVLKGPNPNWS